MHDAGRPFGLRTTRSTKARSPSPALPHPILEILFAELETIFED
jgi:hypothetical protein